MRQSFQLTCAVTLVAAAAGAVGPALAAQSPTSAAPATFVVERAGAGPAMILIPGLTAPGSVWDSTVAHYRDRYQLHVLTLAGSGGVPPVQAPSLERVRDDLVAYIRSHRLERPILVGHSIGGFLAYWVAATAPELVGAVVSLDGATYAPALFDTASTPERAARTAERLRRGIASLTAEGFARQSDAMLAQQITDSAARARVAPLAARSDPATTAEFLATQQTVDLRAASAAIRAPVLLLVATGGIAGEARSAYVASARRQVARMPNARVVEMPHVRHFIMLDDPGGLHAAMDDFLRALPAPRP